MRLRSNHTRAAALVMLLAGGTLAAVPSHADKQGEPDSSPKTVINQTTYLWLLP